MYLLEKIKALKNEMSYFQCKFMHSQMELERAQGELHEYEHTAVESKKDNVNYENDHTDCQEDCDLKHNLS